MDLDKHDDGWRGREVNQFKTLDELNMRDGHEGKEKQRKIQGFWLEKMSTWTTL